MLFAVFTSVHSRVSVPSWASKSTSLISLSAKIRWVGGNWRSLAATFLPTMSNSSSSSGVDVGWGGKGGSLSLLITGVSSAAATSDDSEDVSAT